MKRVLLVLLPGIALMLGLVAGVMLRPAPDDAAEETLSEHEDAAESVEQPDYVKLTNQFVVPILSDGEVVSLVILSLSIEARPGLSEDIYAREPKLRDAFLQVLFDHANAGGFNGDFTKNAALAPLRQALREAALANLGTAVTDVLISDIVRQDG